MAKPGVPRDVLLPPPAPRSFSQKATSDQLVNVTLVLLTDALAMRQHRDVLLDYSELVVPSDIADLGLTANSTYVQSELQSVIDKLDALAANQRAILALLTKVVESPATKIIQIDTS